MSIVVSPGITTTPQYGAGELIFEWNGSDLTQFDTGSPQTHARSGGGPGGSAAASVVADPLYPDNNVIQIVGTLLDGGWLLPISVSELVLPDAFVVEVVTSKAATATNAFTGFCTYTTNGSGVQGIEIQAGCSASQGLYGSAVINNVGGGSTAGSLLNATSSPTSTGRAAAPSTLSAIIQRPNGRTPIAYTTRYRLQTDGAGYYSYGASAGTAPGGLGANWDGLTFNRLGIGLMTVAAVTFTVYFHSVRVWAAPGLYA